MYTRVNNYNSSSENMSYKTLGVQKHLNNSRSQNQDPYIYYKIVLVI